MAEWRTARWPVGDSVSVMIHAVVQEHPQHRRQEEGSADTAIGTAFHVAQADRIHPDPGYGHPATIAVQRTVKGDAGHGVTAEGHAMQHASLAAAPALNL